METQGSASSTSWCSESVSHSSSQVRKTSHSKTCPTPARGLRRFVAELLELLGAPVELGVLLPEQGVAVLLHARDLEKHGERVSVTKKRLLE